MGIDRDLARLAYLEAYASANPDRPPITLRYEAGWWIIENSVGPTHRSTARHAKLLEMTECLQKRSAEVPAETPDPEPGK